MRLDVYQAECLRIADDQTAILDDVVQRLQQAASLSALEQGGVLHAVQVLIENAIGKAKHLLKHQGLNVPVSGYDAFAALARSGLIPAHQLDDWNAAIGLRNRIVHDYMNMDMSVVFALLQQGQHHFIADFLRQPIHA